MLNGWTNSRLGYLRNASNEIQQRQTMSTSMVGEFQLHPAAKVAFVYRIKSFKKMTHTQHTSLRISWSDDATEKSVKKEKSPQKAQQARFLSGDSLYNSSLALSISHQWPIHFVHLNDFCPAPNWLTAWRVSVARVPNNKCCEALTRRRNIPAHRSWPSYVKRT